jgi:catechol 2,3-dioxygenase-like lactoylglutathione lyase family enzyme
VVLGRHGADLDAEMLVGRSSDRDDAGRAASDASVVVTIVPSSEQPVPKCSCLRLGGPGNAATGRDANLLIRRRERVTSSSERATEGAALSDTERPIHIREVGTVFVPSEGRSRGADQTHCAFATDDIDADYATLRARGVEVDDVIGRPGTRRPGLVSKEVSIENPQPPQFHFSDPDGNRFLVVQPT